MSSATPKRLVLAAILPVLLAGCGGGGSFADGSVSGTLTSGTSTAGNSGTSSPVQGDTTTGSSGTGNSTSSDTDDLDFEEAVSETSNFARGFANDKVTSTEDMPRRGSASYSGVAAFTENGQAQFDGSNATMTSDITIEAHFGSGEVTGEFSNFDAADDRHVAGSVPLKQGAISGNTLAANVTGPIRIDDVRHDVDVKLGGVFVGDRHQAIAGVFDGELTNSSNGNVTSLTGVVGTER